MCLPLCVGTWFQSEPKGHILMRKIHNRFKVYWDQTNYHLKLFAHTNTCLLRNLHTTAHTKVSLKWHHITNITEYGQKVKRTNYHIRFVPWFSLLERFARSAIFEFYCRWHFVCHHFTKHQIVWWIKWKSHNPNRSFMVVISMSTESFWKNHSCRWQCGKITVSESHSYLIIGNYSRIIINMISEKLPHSIRTDKRTWVCVYEFMSLLIQTLTCCTLYGCVYVETAFIKLSHNSSATHKDVKTWKIYLLKSCANDTEPPAISSLFFSCFIFSFVGKSIKSFSEVSLDINTGGNHKRRAAEWIVFCFNLSFNCWYHTQTDRHSLEHRGIGISTHFHINCRCQCVLKAPITNHRNYQNKDNRKFHLVILWHRVALKLIPLPVAHDPNAGKCTLHMVTMHACTHAHNVKWCSALVLDNSNNYVY